MSGSGHDLRRRAFLRSSLAAAAAAPLLALPARWVRAEAPADAAGATTVDVRSRGARGDGKTDDTAAIQAAIDALPASGGVVLVPAGHYMVDAERSIRLRPNVEFRMTPDTAIEALPNANTHYSVIKVVRADNARIVGGRVIGERKAHRGDGGEWGFGINVRASHNVSITGTQVSDCWGDGIWIGATGKGATLAISTDVVVDGVVCSNNRRQGLSIGPCKRVKILNSTFRNTHGTAPQSGIDVEPMDQGPVSDVLVQNCHLVDNKGCGLEIHHSVSGLVARGCTITGNKGYGVLAVHVTDLWIDGNTITGNGLNGIVLASKTRDVKVTGNTLRANNNRRVHNLLKSFTSDRDNGGEHGADLRIDKSAVNVTQSGNTY
jgi:polygalacturonase